MSEHQPPTDPEESDQNQTDQAADKFWKLLEPYQQMDVILSWPPLEWFAPKALATLARFRSNAAQWGTIKAAYKDAGGNPYDLEQAVDAEVLRQASHGPARQRAPLLVRLDTVTRALVHWLWYP